MPGYPPRTLTDEEDQPLLSSEQCSAAPHHDLLDSDPRFEGHENEKKLERGLVRKLDIHMSILTVIYIFNAIDRNNAAAARLRGFEDDLGLEGMQFASILSVFYVGYITIQIPSNMLLSQITKPSIYLPCCTMIWGSISFCTGFVTDYHSALITQFFLGIAEAVFFPGALFLIMKWYKRSELSKRVAFFSCGGFISNAFGSLIASGILDSMDGVLGYTAWRWLFFIEGGLTVLIAVLAMFILPDFPENKSISWLTPAEHALARRRMIEDAAGEPHLKPSDKANNATNGLRMAVTDWKVWFLTFAIFFKTIASSFIVYFPTLVSTMGYSPTITLLLCAPPWLVGAIWALWFSAHSDRTGERCMYVVASLVLGIGGFLLAMSTMNTVVRYISFFLMIQGYVGSIFIFTWASSLVSNPSAKRAVALAIINCVSQTGNIIGSYAWPRSWGPTYNKSYAICITTSLTCLVMVLWLRRKLQRLNREMDLAEERARTGGRDPSGKGWRYLL